ncbi:hypothetical protein CC78DRAFT_215060 [Lojkania enalia]|uniref:Uncharacterized protein n=1 Tax=Lojkania enalia TaxID=147567 RepID=A0A9P4N3X9_9PLEO|nr:hypothetical protein CC78DRAFT_215060 [Didymosphaeria enalia]
MNLATFGTNCSRDECCCKRQEQASHAEVNNCVDIHQFYGLESPRCPIVAVSLCKVYCPAHHTESNQLEDKFSHELRHKGVTPEKLEFSFD